MRDQPKNLMTAYRPGAIVALFDENSHVFVAERSDVLGSWQLPQGGIDEGEDPYTGAVRELFEETAIPDTDLTLLTQTNFWTWYDWPSEMKKRRDQKRPEYAHFKGARHKWFFFKYNGEKDSIDLAKAQDKEFVDYKWVKPEWIIENTVDMRKAGYKKAFDYFFTKGALGL